MALGNQAGKTYIWELSDSEPATSQYATLQHPRCTAAIRQTSLSRDGSVLICACDDGTLWRWDKQSS